MGRATVRLAEEHGWPVISEPSGNARTGTQAISTGALMLGVDGALDDIRPDHVLVVGRPTLSRPVMALLRDPRHTVSVVSASPAWADATRTATQVLPALPAPDGRHQPDRGWLEAWLQAERLGRAAVDEVLDGEDAAELRLARDLVASLPSDALLFLGSSMPVRDVFVAAAPRDGVTALANRGAAGIDGTVSSAVGAGLAWQRDGGGRAFALLGDLTALHDGNGLVLGPDEPRPDLTLVVTNNDGGAIFGLLEQGDGADGEAFERVFGTPHGVDLAAWCGATQTPFTRTGSVGAALDAALDPRGGGVQVVELRTSRAAVAPLHRQLREAVAAALTR
jgi:2-succinyl-5-enolpyruvyl-6-hydroxy-3-cyclohexene-1-carboxylate synthase